MHGRPIGPGGTAVAADAKAAGLVVIAGGLKLFALAGPAGLFPLFAPVQFFALGFDLRHRFLMVLFGAVQYRLRFVASALTLVLLASPRRFLFLPFPVAPRLGLGEGQDGRALLLGFGLRLRGFRGFRRSGFGFSR